MCTSPGRILSIFGAAARIRSRFSSFRNRDGSEAACGSRTRSSGDRGGYKSQPDASCGSENGKCVIDAWYCMSLESIRLMFIRRHDGYIALTSACNWHGYRFSWLDRNGNIKKIATLRGYGGPLAVLDCGSGASERGNGTVCACPNHRGGEGHTRGARSGVPNIEKITKIAEIATLRGYGVTLAVPNRGSGASDREIYTVGVCSGHRGARGAHGVRIPACPKRVFFSSAPERSAEGTGGRQKLIVAKKVIFPLLPPRPLTRSTQIICCENRVNR